MAFQENMVDMLEYVATFKGYKAVEAGLLYSEITVGVKKTEKSLTCTLPRFDDTSMCSFQQFGVQLLQQYKQYFDLPKKLSVRRIDIDEEMNQEESREVERAAAVQEEENQKSREVGEQEEIRPPLLNIRDVWKPKKKRKRNHEGNYFSLFLTS